ncbi:MAG: DUF4262 domain-containing protein [Halopseudomonas sp.]
MENLGVFTNGIEQHNALMAAAIESDGIYVKHDEKLSYTVGLSSVGLPELVAVGTDQEQNKALLFDLFYAVKHQVLKLEPGAVDGLFFEDGLALATMSEAEKQSVLFAARTLYGSWDFAAMKMVNGGRNGQQ